MLTIINNFLALAEDTAIVLFRMTFQNSEEDMERINCLEDAGKYSEVN